MAPSNLQSKPWELAPTTVAAPKPKQSANSRTDARDVRTKGAAPSFLRIVLEHANVESPDCNAASHKGPFLGSGMGTLSGRLEQVLYYLDEGI
jgi:hypothetical protein